MTYLSLSLASFPDPASWSQFAINSGIRSPRCRHHIAGTISWFFHRVSKVPQTSCDDNCPSLPGVLQLQSSPESSAQSKQKLSLATARGRGLLVTELTSPLAIMAQTDLIIYLVYYFYLISLTCQSKGLCATPPTLAVFSSLYSPSML